MWIEGTTCKAKIHIFNIKYKHNWQQLSPLSMSKISITVINTHQRQLYHYISKIIIIYLQERHHQWSSLRVRQSSIPPTAEDGYLPTSSQWTVSVAPSFLASMSSFSLTGLLSATLFDTFDKKGGDEEEEWMVWGTGKGLSNLNYSSGLPTDSIITSP